MKRTIKHYLYALAVFLIITSTAPALVGDVGGADLYIQPDRSLSGGDQKGYAEALEPSPSSSSISKSMLYRAPSISGPVEDRLTADQLGLSIPQAESYVPDESLSFTSYPMLMPAAGGAYDEQDLALSDFQAGSGLGKTTSPDPLPAGPSASSGDWYYPGQVSSSNRFYVQTLSGLGTVAGCNYRGYLPLWADIKSKGNFFVYEWYPGESAPLIRSWGWSGPGYKKGWFTGDVPGWHTICYYCGHWSNYVYIYVYPSMLSSAPSSASSTYLAGERAAIEPPIPSTAPSTIPPTGPSTVPSMTAPSTISSSPSAGQPAMQPPLAVSLPARAPTPPDIYSEQLALPNFNLYPPATSQTGERGHIDSSAQGSLSPIALAAYPVQGYPVRSEGKASSAMTKTTFTTSTLVTDGVYSNCPYVDESGSCQGGEFPEGHAPPHGYASKSSKAVFPKPSQCRCNEYYVLSCQGVTDTVAGVYCGEWIPLWSKISRPGEYWSYEWKIRHNPAGKGCNPEVRNFGYKNAGWYQTWFMGSEPGWHILSYYSKDWSNYIYIYVWPAKR